MITCLFHLLKFKLLSTVLSSFTQHKHFCFGLDNLKVMDYTNWDFTEFVDISQIKWLMKIFQIGTKITINCISGYLIKYLCVILEHLGKVATLPSLSVIAFQLLKYGRCIL